MLLLESKVCKVIVNLAKCFDDVEIEIPNPLKDPTLGFAGT